MAATPRLFLGAERRLDGSGSSAASYIPAHHLVTHGVVVGMTGSGKTGLVTVVLEEALRAGIPGRGGGHRPLGFGHGGPAGCSE